MLPTVKTPQKGDVRDLTIAVYGGPKIGKSTLASGAEGAIFLATEPGLNHLSVYQWQRDEDTAPGVHNWADMLRACGEIASGEHDFKTVVIDTVGNAYDMCMDHVCAANKWTHPQDGAHGKGWAAVSGEWKRVLNKLAALPYGLIMIAHDKAQEDQRTGAIKTVPALPPSARLAVVALSDMVLYATAERVKDGDETTTRRVLKTKPSPDYEAGDRTGRLPETLPLNWDAFVDAFNGGDK
jgi:hypothetical protein